MSDEILRMEKITKVYPNGIAANKGVTFSLNQGEIHGLVGENGAGKTTLMKILFGLQHPEKGRILLKGKEVQIPRPQAAIAQGIGMVHQHFMLVPSLTAAENIVMGKEPRRGLVLDQKKAAGITEALSQKYNLQVDPQALVRDLPVGTKQKVEILKALHRGAEILILDEPTAVLTPQETQELFDELRLLRDKGSTIIFISHKLDEIKSLCDRVTIMRGGVHKGVFPVQEVSKEDISRLMVGRDVVLKMEKKPAQPQDTILKVRNLQVISKFQKKTVEDLSFSLRMGEILGVAGVEGNGQQEMVEVLTGLGSFASGNVEIKGQDIRRRSIQEIRALRTSHIPQDRMTYGCAADLSIEMNLLATRQDHPDYNGRFGLKMDVIRTMSEYLVEKYQIRCSSPGQEVGRLSGGNIQKVVVAREFSRGPQLIIADQPTRGIDVGAAEFIRRRLVELRDEGTGILLVSADLNEIMELSDSLIVMYGGKMAAYFENPAQLSDEELGLYMLGVKTQSPQERAMACHD